MGLFSNKYDKSGPGISKDEARKKGMALFFDLLGRKFWSLMWLNVLYDLFFIPIMLMFPAFLLIKNNVASLSVIGVLAVIFAFIIGPATAGMMKVLRYFYIEKHSFIARDFFDGVKENFVKASVIGFIDCFLLVSAFASLQVYPALAATVSKAFYIPMVITFSIFLLVMIMNFYIFLMMTATRLSLKQLIRNSFTLSIVAMRQNLLTVAVIIAVLFLMSILLLNVFQVFALLIPIFPAAFLGFVTCFNCYPVIQKYVIDPYYTERGEVNPEYLTGSGEVEEEAIFEDMGGKEEVIENRPKKKGKIIK
ncbi:MAG TPA: DUF624 domain-containing protein [Ruminococcus flavefaciens]|nr:DUF624 domain-containing protein [Ruminococcus flavefaciens]HQM00376.1 DUF624 domain-containing protein [Ruminococcus flavefaciens]